MLYELIGIVRPNALAEVKEIVQTTGQLILREKGVIRGLSNWGIFALPRATSAHQMRHSTGHYFALRYDASVATQRNVARVLRTDPRMIRHTMVRLGDGKLDGSVSRIGAIGWQRLGMGEEVKRM